MISKHNINMSVTSDKFYSLQRQEYQKKKWITKPGRSVELLKGIFTSIKMTLWFLILRLFMWCIALINLPILKHYLFLGWSQFLHNICLFWCFWFRLQLFSCELFCLCSIKKLVYSGFVLVSLFCLYSISLQV